MKFSPKILTLFTFTTVCAYSFNNNLVARGTPEEEFKQARECKQILDSYYGECFPTEEDSFTAEKFEASCDKIMTQSCEALYKDLTDPSKCSQIITSDSLEAVNHMESVSKLLCSKNESNEFCPFVKLNIFRGDTDAKHYGFIKRRISEEDLEKAINETCESSKCYEGVIKYFELDYNNSISSDFKSDCSDSEYCEIELNKHALKLLKSKECKASGAIALKINYSLLLIGLVLLLSL